METKGNGFLARVFRMKSPEELMASASESNLKKTLGAMDLIILGVGAVIGTGIFTLSGVAIAGEAAAGPSFMISLVLAGLACIFSAFCYAEFASMIPVAGSAYTYTFTTFGQCAAWLMVNIPSILIIALITVLLYKGISESTKSAAVMVAVKLAVIAIFIIAGIFYVKPENWTPFMPNGFGVEGFKSIFQGAFLIFFAYIGFDAVSTAAEETKDPQKNMPIGIIGTLLICITVYVAVAAVLTGMFPFEALVNNQQFVDFLSMLLVLKASSYLTYQLFAHYNIQQ